jgi:hypothetical protein
MDPLAAISSSAAAMVSLNLAAQAGAIDAAGGDPMPATVSAQAQAGTQAGFSVAVLKQTLDLEAADGTELAQLINPGPGMDLYA